MGFLYLLFFILIFVVLLGLVVVFKIVGTVLGLGRRMTQGTTRQSYRRSDPSAAQGEESGSNRSAYDFQPEGSGSPRSERKKIFDDNEGEYVEFEEIKE